MKRTASGVIASAALLSLSITSCSPDSTQGASQDVVTDGTFTMALNADPGNQDPHSSITASLQTLNRFLYDYIVNDDDGKIVSGLAEDWKETDNKIVFTIKSGVTCSDGTPLTASDVAANINYVGDPKSLSAVAGVAMPVGSSATADDASRQVTLTTPQPTGFLLNTLTTFPIVCAAGLKDRSILTSGASGSGPFTIKEAVAGDHYTLERREGYNWGPGGASTATAGVPKQVNLRVVTSETTAANLLLSGELNEANVIGPDVDRLSAAGLKSADLPAITGEIVYNQAAGRATASADVRKALTQALDLKALRDVIGSGKASAPTSLIGLSPCQGDAVTDALVKQDTSAAMAPLKSVGKLKLIYLSYLGPSGAAAAQLVVEQLKAVGVDVEAKALSNTEVSAELFKKADFDISMVPLDATTPTGMRTYFSGAAPADGGLNFARIQNADYDTLSAKAAAMTGTTGCDTWKQAESSLVSNSDVIPFAAANFPLWKSKAEFKAQFGTVLPTTIRVLAQ